MTARFAIGILLTAIVSAPSTNPPFGKRMPKDKEAIHLLNRLSFGPSADSLESLRKLGTRKWIDRQLDPSIVDENPQLEVKLKSLASLSMSQEQLARNYPPRQLLKAFARKENASAASDRKAPPPDSSATNSCARTL